MIVVNALVLALFCWPLANALQRKYVESGAEEDRSTDVKEEFFRNLQDGVGLKSRESSDGGGEVPKPGGLHVYDGKAQNKRAAVKYHVLPSPGLKSHFQVNSRRRRSESDEENDISYQLKIAEEIKANVEKRIGKALDLVLLEATSANATAENATEQASTDETQTTAPSIDYDGDVLVINDFIRFRRSAQEDEDPKGRPKRAQEPGDDGVEGGYGMSGNRNGKMLLEADNVVQDGAREARGATKEEWIKQPYPVLAGDDQNYPDPSGDGIRAPRVHFVTQRRSESIPPIVYRSLDRESRTRDFARDFPRDPEREATFRDYRPARPLRNPNANPTSFRYNRRRDPYYYYDEVRDHRYDSRFDDKFAGNPDRDRYTFSNKQRRIIYYATLPDVVRTPPNVDLSLRDRYSFRDRYDDPYRFRKSQPQQQQQQRAFTLNKSRYEQEPDVRAKAAPYPVKVSTDVNVREIKKNPERRIYSEADRRYAYGKAPYRPADENYNNGRQ